ncbi:hypothetical protein, variant 1 [Verruconis gallopava]|nr:hypothetical protein, variant 1 [Verruconis gallopava]KIW04435.1 hypothetical protein, variant 1 [Verruconis gallopava]
MPTWATTLAIDPHQELLWTGNEYGRVMSFYGHELQKYTSFKAHASEHVKQIIFTEKGVLSVSSRSVHYASRRGLGIWHLADQNFTDLQCMSFTSKDATEILVAGMQNTMFRIDVEKGAILEIIPAHDMYTIMKRGGSHICAATHTGSVHILDSKTFQLIKSWQAHMGWINDMDVKTDFLVTCGYSNRQQLGPMLDGMVNLLSLKTLQPLPPIPFQPGAAFVRIHPRMYTTCVIASLNGQIQVVDVMNSGAVSLVKQAQIFDNTAITSLELAPSGEALAFATTLNQIHLWGSPAKAHFTDHPRETLFPDPIIPHPPMDWSLDTPLNKIGMPYYRELLLSAWPSHMTFEVGAPPPKIEAIVTAHQKRADMGAYAPNPRKGFRNQIQQTRVALSEKSSGALGAPKFLSEKARESAKAGDDEQRPSDALLEHLKDMNITSATRKDVPAIYGNVEIKYSKFGVDDFDFRYYNKTSFSGLETHIANSYANPLLQLYRFTPVIRNIALQHTATECLFDQCMLCELGFLIDMLEKAEGMNCQATNFLKTLSSQPAAQSLNLLEERNPNERLTVMVQKLNTYLLNKFSTDYMMVSTHAQNRPLEQALATKMLATFKCGQCMHEMTRLDDVYSHELIYPQPQRNMGGRNHRSNNPQNHHRQTFSQILKYSVERQEPTRGWCSRCRRYQQMSQRKQVQGVPAVMVMNANVTTNEAKQLWSSPNWVPKEIGIITGNGQFFCYEGQDLELHIQRKVHQIQVYELIGVVCDVKSGENQKSHLVGMLNVSPSSSNTDAKDEWHLFNDFLVTPCSTTEALRFEPTWKLPCVLCYQLKEYSHIIDDSWKTNLDTSILYRKWSAAQSEHLDKFRLLNPTDEVPQPGAPVGIDAEFVALQREEIEIKADGTRETIRPSRLGLARVSVLRGAGPDADLPFIDDYIAITEPIVDYLTQHSGIAPGDLDRQTSSHILVSLKVAYKKLWLLLNLGCTFVGHGLTKDFRTINIHVPKSQVIDTVDLFYIASRQRKLSLRFLAWLLLKEDIQIETHDSVEDARTALKLWRKYEDYRRENTLEEKLEWIYRRGAETRFKVPGKVGASNDEMLGVPPGMLTPGRNTSGRATPELGATASEVASGSPLRSQAGTPVRKAPFGKGSAGFGSPMR